MAFINIGQVVYPVGSIYISTNPTSPSNLFGGEWEVITDAYLRAIGTTGVTVGEYGGYQDYTLTIDQMPSHSHGAITKQAETTSSDWKLYTDQWCGSLDRTQNKVQKFVDKTGGGKSFPMLPRYVSVYMWKRKL